MVKVSLGEEWLGLGYLVIEPDDHTVEIWHKDRLVVRATPSMTYQAMMSYIRHDWNMMVMGWAVKEAEK